MTCRDALSLYWAWTVASLGLVLGHPSLCYPEVTVRTQPVGKSRNLWTVRGYGMGLLTLEGIIQVWGVGRSF